MVKKRLWLVIGTILVLMMLMVIGFWKFDNEEKDLILKSGDELFYTGTITGNGTTTPSYFIYTAIEVSVDIFSTMSSRGLDRPELNIPSFGHDLDAYLPEDKSILGHSGIETYIGNHQISTVFGLKWVRSYIAIDGGLNESIMVDIGVDSSIMYRWTVSSFNASYHYQFHLNSTNNTAIINADRKERGWELEYYNIPTTDRGTVMLSGPGSYSWGIGVVKVGEGQQLHYLLAGWSAISFVMDDDDFIRFGNTGEFSFDQTLSKPFNTENLEVNATVDLGHYWVATVICPSNITVSYDSMDVEGYYIPYWTSH